MATQKVRHEKFIKSRGDISWYLDTFLTKKAQDDGELPALNANIFVIRKNNTNEIECYLIADNKGNVLHINKNGYESLAINLDVLKKIQCKD